MDITRAISADPENTSTWELARALFTSSWQHNDGKTEEDVLFFDNLDPPAIQHLLDTASAAESMLKEYQHEPRELLIYNTAATLYEAYTQHMFSADPGLSWETAPQDVQLFWVQMAKDFIETWKQVKHKQPYEGWYDVEMKRG